MPERSAPKWKNWRSGTWETRIRISPSRSFRISRIRIPRNGMTDGNSCEQIVAATASLEPPLRGRPFLSFPSRTAMEPVRKAVTSGANGNAENSRSCINSWKIPGRKMPRSCCGWETRTGSMASASSSRSTAIPSCRPEPRRRMIGTLAHPLNRPRFDQQGRILAGTYTILQPRVSPSLPSTLASPFSRLFSDPIGIDPYTKAVSDVYQDLSGARLVSTAKGSTTCAPSAASSPAGFPEERLLSHDLIEGEHVRTGLGQRHRAIRRIPPDVL